MDVKPNSPEIVTVTVKYPAGHSYDFAYARTRWHCPFCGKVEVFAHDTMTDGEHSVCLACGEDFYWSAGAGSGEDKTRQIVEQIKAASIRSSQETVRNAVIGRWVY